MSAVTGVVKRVLTTPWQDKLLHGFVLENDDRMFGTGMVKADGVNPGVAISFTPVRNPKGRWNVDPKTIVVSQQVRAPQAPTQTFENKEAKEEYWAVKERVAEFSYARRDAMEMADLLLRNDAIKMPAKKDKFDVIVELVSHLTLDFLKQTEEIRNPDAAQAEPEATPADPIDTPDEEWK